MEDTNILVITGNLTRDPELRAAGSGLTICDMRLGVNGRRKDPASGEWADKPNFFNVTTFGTSAVNAAKYLQKGRRVLVEGRLDWSEWETESGEKRQAVQVIAHKVTYLPSRERSGEEEPEGEVAAEAPAEERELVTVGAAHGEDEDEISF